MRYVLPEKCFSPRFKWQIGLFFIVFSSIAVTSNAQKVSVNATSGTLSAGYATIKAAFNAINLGTHKGAITLRINENTLEGVSPATLNSSGAGNANYTSLNIFPAADGISVSGNPGAGFGVIQLNGADNVTLDGDNPNTAGINRNLTITNTSGNALAYTSVIRLVTSTGSNNCDFNTIKNCILKGNAPLKNTALKNSVSGSENTSFGIYVGGNGGINATDIPLAINSVSANTSLAGETYNNLLIANNTINACARGIIVNGVSTSNSNGLIIQDNLIGDQVTNYTGSFPFISPATTVYVKGISVAGTNSVTLLNNSIKNIVSFVPAAINGIELNTAIGNGVILISGNTVNNIVQNNSADTNKICGMLISNAQGSYIIRSNIIQNIQGWGGSTYAQTTGIYLSTNAAAGLLEKNQVYTVYNRNVNTWGVQGIHLAFGNNITLKNNFIADINQDCTAGSSLNTSFGISGIRIGGGTGHQIVHNSVNLYGNVLGIAASNNLSAAFAVNSVNRKNLLVENNIFSNTMAGGTSGVAHVSIALPSAGNASMNLTQNNNIYFCGNNSNTQGIALVGANLGSGFYLPANFDSSLITPSSNLRAYTSKLSIAANNDNASIASDKLAPFNSSTDLHIISALPESKFLDSTGTNVSVDKDIDEETRNVDFPDIGADEFSVTTNIDIAIASLISPLSNSCHGPAEDVIVSIRNASGSLIDFAVNPVTITVNVTGVITDVLTVTVSSGILLPNEAQNVTIGQINTASAGNYNFSYQVSLVSGTDVFLLNNTGNNSITNKLLTAAATALPLSICAGNSAILSVQAEGGNESYSYLWNDGTAILESVNSTGILNTSTNYSVIVTDGCSASLSANVSVNVVNPVVLSTQPATRCGAGAVQLNATGSIGTTLNWYDGLSSNTIVGSGSVFNTPVIDTSTTFYVSGLSNVTNFAGGRITPAATSATIFTNAGLVFDVTQRFLLHSVDVFPNHSAATYFSVTLLDKDGVVLFTTPVQKAPASNGTTPYTVNLGWGIDPGTGYRLILSDEVSGNLVREVAGFSPGYPYQLGSSGSITGGWFSGASTSYYFFYNWNISSGCESTRIPVTATITAAPSISTDGSTTAICEGNTASLVVNSQENSGYTYTWTPGNLSGSSILVSPTATTTYTVNADDNSGGIYAGCSISKDILVVVSAIPNVTISPTSLEICAGSNASLLSVNPAVSKSRTILSENFDAGAIAWSITHTEPSTLKSTWQYEVPPYTDTAGSATFANFSTINGGKFAFANSDAGGPNSITDTKLTSPAFSTVGYLDASLTFENLYRSWVGDVNVALEISTNGGAVWSILKDYKSKGSQGITTDDLQATIRDTINLSAYINKSNLKVRFNFKSEWGYYWIIDDFTVSGTPDSSVITWSPIAGLYEDANALVPYSGGITDSVYAKPETTSTFTATATNAGNCSALQNVTIIVNALPTVNAGANQTICSNSIVNLNGVIGGGASSAIWTTSGSGTFGNINNPVTTYAPSNSDRASGSVTLTLTTNDPSGPCTAVASSIIISIKPSLVLNIVKGDIACWGGTTTVTINASGGTPPYSGTGTFNAAAGTFTRTVSDAFGCTRTITGTILQPSKLNATATSGSPILCNGGTTTITVAATGGVGPYTGTGIFTVGAGPYSFTVTDANNCTTIVTGTVIEPTLFSATATPGAPILCAGGTTTITVAATGGVGPYTGTGIFTIGSGPYSFTVTDANNCTTNVTGTVIEPAFFSASATPGSPILCNGGTTTITVAATGGVGPYTGTGEFTVGAGPYSFTVTDANNCTAIVTGTVIEPILFEATATLGTPILCNGGTTTITVAATGGVGPYTGTGEFTVGAGPYSFTVTDANNCTTIVTGTVDNNSVLSASATSGIPILCSGGTTTVTVAATGGAGPYTGTGEFTAGAGPYSFTVTDANNCTAIVTGSVIEPALFSATATLGTPILCNGGTTTINVAATGGVGPYTGTGEFTVGAGPYSFTVTDANNCTAIVTGTVIEPALFSATATSGAPILCAGGTTTITVAATGGVGPYTGTGIFTVGAGSYNYIITDANNCTASANIVITQPSPLTASICYSTGTKILHVVGVGGSAPYKYSRNGIQYFAANTTDGGVNVTVNPGSYTVFIKDNNNCILKRRFTISNLPACPSSVIKPITENISSAAANSSVPEVIVFPNPSEQYFNLRLNFTNKEGVEIRVLDMYGKTVYTAHGSSQQNYRFGANFASGTYFVEVVQGQQRKIIKIVKV